MKKRELNYAAVKPSGNSGTISIIIASLLILLLAAVLPIYIKKSIDVIRTSNYIVTLIIALLIIGVAAYGLIKGIRPLIKCQKALFTAQERILRISQQSGDGVSIYRQLETTLFERNSFCGALWAQYCDAHEQQSGEDENTYDDIASYFNPETICEQQKHEPILELVPGICTGLGILGTFVGLIFGLYGFKMGDQNAMIQTMPAMIEGLWTAFMTSIFGILMSLIYSFFARTIEKQTEEIAGQFVQCYYRNVSKKKTHNDALSKLVDIEKEQVVSLKDFSETISVQMCKSLNEIVAPMMQELNEKLQLFVEMSAEKQVSGVEMMTEKFVESLNKTLGDSLIGLAETINELNQHTKENFNAIDAVVEQIEAHTDNIRGINDEMKKTLSEQKRAADSMADAAEAFEKTGERDRAFREEWQEKALGITQSFTEQIVLSEKMTAEQKLMVEECVGIRQSGIEIADKIDGIFGVFNRTADSITQSIKASADDMTASAKVQSETLEHIAQGISQDMKQSAAMLGEASTDWRTELSDSIAGVCGALSGSMDSAAAKMNETLEQAVQHQNAELENLYNETRSINQELIDGMARQAEDIKTSMDEQAERFGEIARSVSEDLEKSTNAMQGSSEEWKAGFSEDMQKICEIFEKSVSEVSAQMSGDMSRTVQLQLEKMQEICAIVKNQTENYSQEMQNMYMKVRRELTMSFEQTFKSFEDNMVKVSDHLGGTISEIKDATEETPMVLRKAFERFESEMDKEIARLKAFSTAQRSGDE